MMIGYQQLLVLATLISAICMFLSALLLIGFRRGRLRAYNVVVVFVVSALAAVYYAKFATGIVREDWEAAAWGALAVCAGYGLWGMVRLAKTDPPVWRRDGRRQ